jgi:hypothetical protein
VVGSAQSPAGITGGGQSRPRTVRARRTSRRHRESLELVARSYRPPRIGQLPRSGDCPAGAETPAARAGLPTGQCGPRSWRRWDRRTHRCAGAHRPVRTRCRCPARCAPGDRVRTRIPRPRRSPAQGRTGRAAALRRHLDAGCETSQSKARKPANAMPCPAARLCLLPMWASAMVGASTRGVRRCPATQRSCVTTTS